jgi:DNA-binding NarL/FixJ family response regulator
MPHHIFIVEDHPLMRDMMAKYIADLPGLRVCGSVPTAEAALDHLPGTADFVLVDISLPGMNGIDLIGAIRTRWPDLVCLVCSGHDEASYVVRALDAGARGYVAKGSPSELVEGLDCVRRGEPYLSPSLRDRVEGVISIPEAHDANTRTD